MSEKGNQTHKITWYVWADGQMIRRQSSMRGQWGYDAKCSCGWESRTGGGTKQYVTEKVQDHKLGF